MIKYLNNILKSGILVGLITVLLTPSVLNFIHSFEHEEHIIECHQSDTHLHEVDSDCDYCKLKLNQNYYAVITNTKLVRIVIPSTLTHASYSYLYNYQHLSFSLRAPPVLV